MPVVLLWVLSVVLGFSLEIDVNFGKENNQDFSVLNLNHDLPFECKENYDVYGEVVSVVCRVNQTPVNNFVPTNTVFFHLETEVKDHAFYLIITPKHKAKLFSTFIDLKTPTPIPKERPNKSRHWQIIGYIKDLPFLSGVKTSGLNFPVRIPSVEHLYLKQLDINLRPLHYEEGLDFEKLKEVRTLSAQQKYNDVIDLSNKSLKSFPTSIFKKDFLFYKIKALSHLPNKENLNTIITLALEWIKEYPSDKLIPEMLYILANTYAQMYLNDEAYYYYKRIINEYADTQWMALAKMQMAKHFASEGLFKVRPNYFAQAYKSAKTKAIADEIAVEWALFNLNENEKEKSKELLDLVLKNNPDYLLENIQRSISLAHAFANKDLYESAAHLGSYLIEHLDPKDDHLENLINNVAQWYQSAGDFEKARAYNLEFLNRYPNSKQYSSVALRNDRLLFDLDQNQPQERIKRMDEIIVKYPNIPETKRAYLIKAQALFELKEYEEVLKLQDHLGDSPLIAESKNALILGLLKNKECKKVPPYLQGSNTSAFSPTEKLELFDCLYSIARYQDAKNLLSNVSLEDKNAQEKLPYTYRLAKVLYELGDYTSSRLAAEDTSSIAHALGLKEYYDVDFYLFYDLAWLHFEEKAQQVSALLQENFKEDPRMLKVWRVLLDWAKEKGENHTLEIYAKEILALQNKVKNYDDSPYVNLVLIQAFNQTGKLQESKAEIASLLQRNLTPPERQKILYIQGTLLKSLGEDAQPSFKECAQINVSSSWKNLCEQSVVKN